MSESNPKMNEFEKLLESVAPAEPTGNPMQIMFLAGQQSVASQAKKSGTVAFWQASTLVSTAVSAVLLFLVLGVASPQPVESQPMVSGLEARQEKEIAKSRQLDSDKTDGKSVSVGPTAEVQPIASWNRLERIHVHRRIPFELAMSRFPKSSVDLFKDFSIETVQRKSTAGESIQ